MENTPKEIVVTVPESLAGISIRKDIHYSDDTVISIRVEEHEDEQGTGTVHPMASSPMSSVGRNFGSSPVLSYGVASMEVHEIEPPQLLAGSVGKM